jgi:archaeosine synthase beta-subunit
MVHEPSSYPEPAQLRDEWILSRRGERNAVDAWRPYAAVLERERTATGEVVPVGTIFLTNKECPWRCLMCDLWKNTLTERVPSGAIPQQIRAGLKQLGIGVRHLKLYNSGSFFDPQAIPPEDHASIAELVRDFENVVVESHPTLIGPKVLAFASEVMLEVAMGLETAHPETLARLNKRMTLDQFARAAEFLVRSSVAVRAFVLIKPPFLEEEEAVEWAMKSVDFAFDCGASVVSLIPVRSGNGALNDLGYVPPALETIEAVFDAVLRERTFMDLWDLEKFATCPKCFRSRRERLERMNFDQRVLPRVTCDACGI